MRTPSTAAPRFDLPAHEVRRFTDRTTLLIAPDGSHVLVAAPIRRLVSVLTHCDGSSSIGQIAASSPEPTITLELLRGLVDAGCLDVADVKVGACLEASR
jgi:hypothetical protein